MQNFIDLSQGIAGKKKWTFLAWHICNPYLEVSLKSIKL